MMDLAVTIWAVESVNQNSGCLSMYFQAYICQSHYKGHARRQPACCSLPACPRQLNSSAVIDEGLVLFDGWSLTKG